MLVACNKKLVCAPFPSLSISIKSSKGFATPEQRTELVSTRVLVGNDFAPAGARVFLRSEVFQHVWAKEEFAPDDSLRTSGLDSSFVLVPQDFVVMIAPAGDQDG